MAVTVWEVLCDFPQGCQAPLNRRKIGMDGLTWAGTLQSCCKDRSEEHVLSIYICGSHPEIWRSPENVVLRVQRCWGQGKVSGCLLFCKLLMGPFHVLRLRASNVASIRNQCCY